MTTYRQLTHEELTGLADRIAYSGQWLEVVEFAKNFYGPNVYRVVVSTGEEYNDETYDTVIEEVEVYDKDGNALEVDLSTPWWQEKRKEYNGYCERYGYDRGDEDFKGYGYESEARHNITPPSVSPAEYFVTAAPKDIIPAVFVRVDD